MDYQQDLNGFGGGALPSPFAYKPRPVAPQAVPAPLAAAAPAPVVVGAPVAPPATTPTAAPTLTPLAYSAAMGAQAGAPAAAAYDTKSGVIGALGAGASGATAGAIVGGPMGALAGGALGLLTGGLNAYLSVGAKNKAKREQNRLLREAEMKQAKRDKIARDDALSQQAYDRKQLALQKKWAKNLQVREAIKGLVTDETAARDRYVETGRV